MKRFFKIFSIAVAIAVLAVVAAIFFIWHSINASYIQKLLRSKLDELKNKNITITISSISVYKKFPSLDIRAKSVFAEEKNIKLTVINADIKINIAKLIVSKLSHKNYFGDISVQKISVNLKREKTSKAFSLPQTLPEIPYIPISLSIPDIEINTTGLNIHGKLNLKTSIIFKTNELVFEGSINKTNLKADIKLKHKSIGFKATMPLLKKDGFLAKNIAIKGAFNRKLSLNLEAKAGFSSFKGFILKQPTLYLEGRANSSQFEVKSFNLKTKNGYELRLDGMVNIRKPLLSHVKGYISTPYINGSKLLFLLPQSAKPYIKSAYFSLKKVSFSGMPSLSFVKSGTILIKDVKFRINTKDPYFLIKNGVVKIYPKKIVMIADGKFDRIDAERSKFVIYRGKRLSSDIHLSLRGKATELVRSFIEENILSKSDLKLLGRSKNLKGRIRATIDVYGYSFKPKPYFSFDVKLFPNSVEFSNPNIPNGWIRASGFVEIKRVARKGKIKGFFVSFRNFKAKTKESDLYTQNFKLNIYPSIGLNGSFTANISRSELSILELELAKKKDPLKFKMAKLSGSVSGNFKDLTFTTHIAIPITIKGIGLDCLVKGEFKPPTLNIYSMTVKGIGDVVISAKVNTKKGRIAFLNFKANGLNISDIKQLIPIKTSLSGVVNGNVKLNFKKGKPIIKQVNLSLDKGKFNLLDNITAFVKLMDGRLEIYNTSFYLDKNLIVAKGNYNIKTNSINLRLHANKFYLDTNRIFKGKKRKKSKPAELKLPDTKITVKFDIINLYLKFKNKIKNLLATTILFKNTDKHLILNLQSAVSRWKITENKQNGHISIRVRDWALWPFITNCSNQKNFMEIDSSLNARNPKILNLKSIWGTIDFRAYNGCITKAPSALNLMALLNPFSTFLGGFGKTKGLTYKKIKAHLFLKDGVLKTVKDSAVIFDGKNIDMFAYGKYDLIKDRIDAYVTFITFSTINKIVSHIPIVGWIIGGKSKSFTGLSFRVHGDINHPSIKPVPFKNLAKGVLGVVKRTIMLPLSIFGVK